LKLNNRKFPGSMPVSLDRCHLPRIQGTLPGSYTEYAVSAKLDGDRYFMGLLAVNGDNILFLVNRKFETFCKAGANFTHEDYFTGGTLFDAEIIGTDIILFDCMTCCGHSVKHLSYLHRIELVRAFLQDCKGELVAHNAFEYPSNFQSYKMVITPSLVLHCKPVFPMCHVKHVSSQWPDDGLIFTEVQVPYQPFRCSETAVLKWKPAHRMTIDFEIIARHRRFTLSDEWPDRYKQHTGHKSMRLGLSIVSHIDTEEEGIAECFWDGIQWQVVQIRTDKVTPNTLDTGLRTLGSIQAGISMTDITF